jgi:hypothetical protein
MIVTSVAVIVCVPPSPGSPNSTCTVAVSTSGEPVARSRCRSAGRFRCRR